MEKVLLKLTRFDSNLLQKSSFILQKNFKAFVKKKVFKKYQKKFVQTRYQQSKESFCKFSYKMEFLVKITSNRGLLKNILKQSFLLSSAGLKIKQ